MPIYEYQCKACNSISDALQKMSDAPLVTCPECNEDALKKLVSAPRFRLAGSGWYETDFKDDNKRNLVSSDNKGKELKNDSKADAKGETNTDTKSSESKTSSTESKSKTKITTTPKKDDGKAA